MERIVVGHVIGLVLMLMLMIVLACPVRHMGMILLL